MKNFRNDLNSVGGKIQRFSFHNGQENLVYMYIWEINQPVGTLTRFEATPEARYCRGRFFLQKLP